MTVILPGRIEIDTALLGTPSKPEAATGPNQAAPRVAVLVPCRNEAAAIARVVADFSVALPSAKIYVYDNNSTDDTIAEARRAGAVVGHEARQGKGHVVRRMFADIQADAYVLVDGDDTYAAEIAPDMLDLLMRGQLDMVSAARCGTGRTAYRRGHRLGNALLSGMVCRAFGTGVSDMLSGYRVLSRRFVKSFPALSTGFEIETELTVHALALNMPLAEVRAAYRPRGAGSSSKLNTLRDGLRILRAIVMLIQQERPLQVFSACSAVLCGLGIGLGLPLILHFLRTGLVPRTPTAVLSTGLMMLAFLSLVSGLILDAIARDKKELRRLAYLSIPAPGCGP